MNEQELLAEFQALWDIRNGRRNPLVKFLIGDNSDAHYRQYIKLWHLVRTNQDTLLSVILNWRKHNLTEDQLLEMVGFGGHGGSASYEDNTMWHEFTARVREHSSELPDFIQERLKWQLEVHGW